MARYASPMAWLEVAQAVTMGSVGPFAAKRMDTVPAAMLEIIIGTMNGETRFAPWQSLSLFSVVVRMPPMPLPMYTPSRSGSTVPAILLSCMACVAAATAYCTNRSFLRSSLFSKCSSGSKPLTSAATLTFFSEASKRVMKSTPQTPLTRELQYSSRWLPTGVTAPIPVTTTLLMSSFLSRPAGDYMAMPPSTRMTSPVM